MQIARMGALSSNCGDLQIFAEDLTLWSENNRGKEQQRERSEAYAAVDSASEGLTRSRNSFEGLK